MAALNQFAVVTFPEEDTVEVVSTKWLSLDKTECHWPSAIGARFRKILFEHLDPFIDTNFQWEVYKCEFFGAFGSWEKAQEKCQKGQYTSNLDTSAAEDNTNQRRKTRLSRIERKNRPTVTTPLTSVISRETESTASSSPSPPAPTNSKSKGLSSKLGSGSGPPRLSLAPIPITKLNYSPVPTSSESQHVSSNTVINPALLHDLLKNLDNKLDQEIKNRARFEEVVLNHLVTINNGIKELLHRSVQNSTPDLEEVSVNLPVSSLETFAELKNWIDVQENYKSVLPQLTVLGGRDPKSITHNILDALIGQNVAVELSFTGKGSASKDGFKDTKLLELIYEAVRKTKGGTQATNSDIKEYIKNFLKNSSDKKGGRDKRRLKKQDPTGIQQEGSATSSIPAEVQNEDVAANTSTAA